QGGHAPRLHRRTGVGAHRPPAPVERRPADRPVSVVLSELVLGGPAAPWEALGFTAQDDTVRIGAVTLRFFKSEPAGIHGWALAGAQGGDIDGLATAHAEAADPAPAPAHPNGALRLDHVVVFTPDLDRTFSALLAAGL